MAKLGEVKHADYYAYLEYLQANGLEEAGEWEWVPDPEHPGRMTVRVAVRPRRIGHVKPGEQLAAAAAG